MIQELFQLYADRWQFFLKLTLQHLEISLIAIVAALCIGLTQMPGSPMECPTTRG